MKKPNLLLFLFLYLTLPCLAQESKVEEGKEKKIVKDNFIELKGGNYPLGEDNIPITLSPFAISSTETTYGQMEAFALANGLNPKRFHELTRDEPDRDMPAINVNWFDAIRYANWLSSQSGLPNPYTIYGENNVVLQPANTAYWNDQSWLKIELDLSKKGYRLPTEAEWEYAASGYEVLGRKQVWAGTDQADSLKYYACFAVNPVHKAHKTASLQPNPLGIYDMSGNVWEWCFDENYFSFDTFKNRIDPFEQSLRKPSDTVRSLRGGSWGNFYVRCQVLNRIYLSSGAYVSLNSFGFRLSRTL